MNAWTLLFVVYGAVFISSPLIAVFHELGHAFAYLILTKPGKIDIYIGSYGDKENAFHFKAGKLYFYVKKSFPFIKGIGLCSSSKSEDNYFKYIIILLAGAVFTLISAALIALIAFTTNANMLIQIFLYIFLGFSALSLIGNLLPRELKTTTGIGLSSDGNQIAFTLKLKDQLINYNKGAWYFKEKKYGEAVTEFQKVLVAKPGELKLLRILIYATAQQKKYTDAEAYVSALEKVTELSINDLVNKGCIQSAMRKSDDAILTYQQALKRDKHNLIALNNVAVELIDKGAYIIAQRALDKLFKIKPNYVYAYNTMAYMKITQGFMDEAKKLIDKCFELAPENAYVFKNLGIYYLKQSDAVQATTNFNKAIELDDSISVDEYSDELEKLSEKQVPV